MKCHVLQYRPLLFGGIPDVLGLWMFKDGSNPVEWLGVFAANTLKNSFGTSKMTDEFSGGAAANLGKFGQHKGCNKLGCFHKIWEY